MYISSTLFQLHNPFWWMGMGSGFHSKLGVANYPLVRSHCHQAGWVRAGMCILQDKVSTEFQSAFNSSAHSEHQLDYVSKDLEAVVGDWRKFSESLYFVILVFYNSSFDNKNLQNSMSVLHR